MMMRRAKDWVKAISKFVSCSRCLANRPERCDRRQSCSRRGARIFSWPGVIKSYTAVQMMATLIRGRVETGLSPK